MTNFVLFDLRIFEILFALEFNAFKSDNPLIFCVTLSINFLCDIMVCSHTLSGCRRASPELSGNLDKVRGHRRNPALGTCNSVQLVQDFSLSIDG
jgi:hypothetical protein